MKKTRICVVLTTRGSVGKLASLIRECSKNEAVTLEVLVGGMLTSDKHGTFDSIYGDFLGVPVRIISCLASDGSLVGMVKTSALAMLEFATAFEEIQPDVVVIVGDRFETLGICQAAAFLNIRVAHVEGGEVSGSIDESIRHAITKLSHFHFVASEDAYKRVIRLGEDPDWVQNVGATSLDLLGENTKEGLATVRTLQTSIGSGDILELRRRRYLVVIQHPVTTEFEENYAHARRLIDALEAFPHEKVWIMPNVDGGAEGILKAIRSGRDSGKISRTHFFKSLGFQNYGPLIANAACLVGNSSSGIREAAFLGTPVVNIGNRQSGRERSGNVLDVVSNVSDIKHAISQQLANGEYEPSHIYGAGDSASKIIEVLTGQVPPIQKMICY